MDRNASFAIVGAGMSGLTCARRLVDAGLQVRVFEKSRGLGGRMATRRASDGLHFDHGAQYFTARDPRFKREVESWIRAGIAARWDGQICSIRDANIERPQGNTDRFVGTPRMNSVCRQLATGLDVQLRARVVHPERKGSLWCIRSDQGEEFGEFDAVVVSAPAPQAADLLASAPNLREAARNCTHAGLLGGNGLFRWFA